MPSRSRFVVADQRIIGGANDVGMPESSVNQPPLVSQQLVASVHDLRRHIRARSALPRSVRPRASPGSVLVRPQKYGRCAVYAVNEVYRNLAKTDRMAQSRPRD